MKPIDIARKLAEYKQIEDAQRAYTIFLQQEEKTPEEELEAAAYLFFSGGDYHLPYTVLVSLYERGQFQEECLSILTNGFYEPNRKKLERRYQKNCKLLKQYSYLFRKDFLSFSDLPILFYPYDDNSYIPFEKQTASFRPQINFNTPVITRNFFKNLDDPILASDVYSQYELEYLHDNVRKSEWVGRENHIYLHYTSWPEFCAHLQCLNLRPLLEEKKVVFLIEDEIAQYPIDFKARFGIDYCQYPVKPLGIREITRLIWHTQLSSHNGGDFFNEILYDHPNVLSYSSLMYHHILDGLLFLTEKVNARKSFQMSNEISRDRVLELVGLSPITVKDALVAYFLGADGLNQKIDAGSRITPALLMQPHFHNMIYKMKLNEHETAAVLSSDEYDSIQNSPIFQGFKYIKTFTPLRRLTTSYAASVRFGQENRKADQTYQDTLLQRVLNRSFMVGAEDRLYQDSVLVRFEDGKLNPKATFTALAAFLDLPYTKSMTYCSGKDGVDPESLPGNARGFDPAPVYRTYDEFADDAERTLLEALMKDVYTEYGYDFHYYKGEPLDDAWLEDVLSRCHCLQHMIEETYSGSYQAVMEKIIQDTEGVEIQWGEDDEEQSLKDYLNNMDENRRHVIKTLLSGLHFVDQNGQPLHFMKKLELDPALLEQPLYH